MNFLYIVASRICSYNVLLSVCVVGNERPMVPPCRPHHQAHHTTMPTTLPIHSTTMPTTSPGPLYHPFTVPPCRPHYPALCTTRPTVPPIHYHHADHTTMPTVPPGPLYHCVCCATWFASVLCVVLHCS